MPNTIRAFEALSGLTLNSASIDMLRKREAAKAQDTLAKALLEQEMLAALVAKNFSR